MAINGNATTNNIVSCCFTPLSIVRVISGSQHLTLMGFEGTKNEYLHLRFRHLFHITRFLYGYYRREMAAINGNFQLRFRFWPSVKAITV